MRHKSNLVLGSPVHGKGKECGRQEEADCSYVPDAGSHHSTSRPVAIPVTTHRRSKSSFDTRNSMSPSYNTPDMVPNIEQISSNVVST